MDSAYSLYVKNKILIFIIAGIVTNFACVWTYTSVIELYKNSEFLIPYIIANVFCIIPLILCEFYIGKYYNSSSVKIYRNASYHAEILGWLSNYANLITTCYYVVVVGICFAYFPTTSTLFTGDGLMFTMRNIGEKVIYIDNTNYTLSQGISVKLVVACLLVWVLVYYLSKREWRNFIRKVHSFFIPIFLFLGLGIFAISVDRSSITYFINNFDLSNLFSSAYFVSWINAFKYAVFSSGVGLGIYMTLGRIFVKDTDYTEADKFIDIRKIIFSIIFILLFKIIFTLALYFAIHQSVVDGYITLTDFESNYFLILYILAYNLSLVVHSELLMQILFAILLFIIFIFTLSIILVNVKCISFSIKSKFNNKKMVNAVYLIGILVTIIFSTYAGFAFLNEIIMTNIFLIIVLFGLIIEVLTILDITSKKSIMGKIFPVDNPKYVKIYNICRCFLLFELVLVAVFGMYFYMIDLMGQNNIYKIYSLIFSGIFIFSGMILSYFLSAAIWEKKYIIKEKGISKKNEENL